MNTKTIIELESKGNRTRTQEVVISSHQHLSARLQRITMLATLPFSSYHRRLIASLTLAYITVATSFEVPFPQSASQIRSTIVSDNNIATPSTSSASSLPTPITQTVQLSTGTKAEVISCHPKRRQQSNFFDTLFFGAVDKKNVEKKPVLVFLHGSFHASWCWAEYYMPFFAERGYECVAFSLQGTGGTPGKF